MLSHSPRIILVEDDAPIRTTLDVSLRGEGYQVRALPDGTELLQMAEEFRLDLAILDVRLDVGPDGYAACAACAA